MLTVVQRISRETWILAIICLVDLILTCVLVQGEKAQEGNPLFNYFLQCGITVFIGMKLIFITLPLLILEWARSYKPIFVRRTARLCIVAYLGMYGLLFLHVNIPLLMNQPAYGETYYMPAKPSLVQPARNLQEKSQIMGQEKLA
jgi:hypothetical protein